MALDDFQMPNFKDPDGSTWIWDSASKSYVKAPLTDKRPDQSHATGGDNDLFDPFQHTEQDSVPELEGYMARTASEHEGWDEEDEGWGEDGKWNGTLYPDEHVWGWGGRERWHPGDHAFFEYHCHQGHDSSDAQLWYRSHQPVTVIREVDSDGDWGNQNARADAGTPRGYEVQFEDGETGHVMEDELTVDPKHWDTRGFEGGGWGPPADWQERLGPIERDYNLTDLNKTSGIDEPPFPAEHEVKCPNCGETTAEHTCPNCMKDLTPEWNVHGQDNEFFDAHPDYNDAKEFWTWPQNVPKKNELNYDDSFPSMSLSKTAEALTDDWDDMFSESGPSMPMRTEIGKWILDSHGQLHIDHGMSVTHPAIEQRDGLDQSQEIALGSVYNDGTADVQAVFQPQWFNLQAAQEQITQAFGPVELQPPMGAAEQKGQVFPPFEIQEGQWFIPPNFQQPITGIAWVKERSMGIEYEPHMILCAEHLRDDDFILYSKGAAAIITAMGGAGSHAAYLAMTSNLPIIVGVGEAYNKVETGNYLKIDPTNETITVIPGATGEMSSGQKHQIWNSILDYQRQRGGSVKPQQFSHFHEELAWKEANAPTLEDCPECSAPMMDQDGESVCHDCGHKQPIIHAAGALAIPALAEGVADAAGAAGGAGGGISGIGGLMNSALGRGVAFRAGENLVGGGKGNGTTVNVNGGGGGGTSFDPNAGTVSHRFAAENMRHQAFLSEIWALIQDALKGVNWGNIGGALAANPIDDALFAAGTGAAGTANQSAQNALPQPVSNRTAALGDDDDPDSVGLATKNDGTNSTQDASNSSIEGKKEQGDGPEQLKDVDGDHDSVDFDEQTPWKNTGDPDSQDAQADPHMQEKALKAFHMNLPLVIEFANSDEPGADHPILQALDALLEEAFPGYKDGHDQENGATDEHPEEKSETPEERDEDADEPDAKSEGDDKKEIHIHAKTLKEGVWHYAWGNPGDGYNEGMEMAPELYGGPAPYVVCPNCEYGEPYGEFERRENEGEDPYRCPKCGEEMSDPNDEPFDDFDAYDGPGEYEMYGPDRPTMQEMFPHEGKSAAGGPEAWNMRRTLDGPWDAYQEEQPAAQGWGQGQWQPFQGEQPGATEAYSCQNCGEQHEFPATSDPRSLPSCPQCGARAWTHSGLQQTYAKTSTLDPGQPMGQPVPAGAGGPAMQMCPRCGQAHTAGSPCPVADVTTPITTGEGMAAAPATHVVTKWHLAVPANVPASQPQIAAGAQAAPATTCPSCGQNHIPGTPCPTPQMQQPGATGQPANLATPAIGPGVQYAHTASDDESDHTEDHTEDHSDYHSEDDWTDEAGAPLEEGAQYEMRVAASPIPDRVTIERILPEKLSVLYHTGDVDFRDSITRDQLEMDGTTFTPVDFDDTDEDSMDTFPGEEMPIRPGADALPQEDDLSSPTTVMSNYEPVSLDTYTGSFAGDSVDDRSWLMEGDGSVDVDPALMAKVAGKNFSPREQREFIDESGTARNLDRLDLEGTHYIDEELHTSDSLW